MNNFFELIDKYKFGIIGAFATAIGIFMYLELTYVPEFRELKPFFESVEMQPEEELQKLELTKENIEIPPQFEAGKVTNTVRDANDSRERSEENWSATKSFSDVEKAIKEEERKMFEETGGEAKRKAIKEQDEQRKNIQNQSNKERFASQKASSSSQGTGNAIKGNVMVEWSLTNRSPHQNNEWNVRNPGYTCGYGSAGRVVVTIKVGQDGRVVSAVYDPANSSSANPCMIEQALKYAKLSRFDYSSTETGQIGKIFYTFISQ